MAEVSCVTWPNPNNQTEILLLLFLAVSVSCSLFSSFVGVVFLFLSGIFSLLSSCTALRGSSWGGASPPIHRSGWHRERRVHANLAPAHLIVPELIIKSASEPIQRGLFWKETGAGRGRLPESRTITLSDTVVFTPHFEAPALPSGKSHKQLSWGSESGCIWMWEPVQHLEVEPTKSWFDESTKLLHTILFICANRLFNR